MPSRFPPLWLACAACVVLTGVAIGCGSRTPTAVPFALWPSPTSDISSPTVKREPTPAPVSTPSPTILVVANTGGDGVYIRRQPVAADKIKAWADGTKMIVVGTQTQGEGRLWQNVKDPDGNVGWVPSEYLVPLAPTPTGQETATPRRLASGLYAGIQTFLDQYPQYGKAESVTEQPDWAQGKRQQVRTSQGTYLFYLTGDEVVGVWTVDPVTGERKQVYQKAAPTPAANVERPQTDTLPAYFIISQSVILAGGKRGDVLVPSLSRATPASQRETTLRAISAKEGFTEAAMYCSNEAYEANVSATYRRQHPDALSQCFLGSLAGNVFTPGERLFP